ncbi:MAG: T9SS C-terminal target domain-containing protein, partial [Bacteroidota bacterium]
MKIVLFILVTNITVLVGQTPVIDWQKSYGGSESDIATSIVKLPNGEYVICGFSESDDGDVVNHHGFSGGSDFWIYKIDSLGTIIWSNCLGGTLGEEAYSLSNTYDGGFLVVGTTTSNDFDVSGLHGGGPFGGNE